MSTRRGFALLLLAALLWPGYAPAQGKGKKGKKTPAPASAPAAEPPAPPPASAPAATADTPPPASEPAFVEPVLADDATYDAEVKETEEKVADLKERVFRSKARLLLLKEALIGGAFGTAKAILIHKNDMGRALRLERASYSLDGVPVFVKTDVDGALSKQREFEIFNQPISPGPHVLSVELIYKGDGFGVFDYLDKYTFRIKSSFTFQIEDGKATQVKVVSYEKGGPLVKLEERPTVRFDTKVSKVAGTGTDEAESQPAAEPEKGKKKKGKDK